MVNYSCEKCGKTFKQKGHYMKHLQRKTPCDNIKDKIENIVEKKVDELVKEKLQDLVEKGDIEIKNKSLISSNQNSNTENTEMEGQKIKFIDLFCGIGGFHTGLIEDKCVFASDIDPSCREVYKNNYNIEPYGDIFNIKSNEVPDHDILCSGFPCQPYSIAGKQNGLNDKRADTYKKMLDIIKTKKPKIIILENVKNLQIINKGEVFKMIIDDLTKINYNISHSVLNTSNFGLPQNRERLFIIGINKDYNTKSFNFNNLSKNKINKKLSDIISVNNNYIEPEKYVILDDKHIKVQKSGLIFTGYIKGKIRGKGALPNTEHLSRVHKQPNRIYHVNGVNPTLSSSESSGRYYIFDGVGVRKLTIDECYHIMGFDNLIKHNKINKCYNHIGNAVSPYIIREIRKELNNQSFI